MDKYFKLANCEKFGDYVIAKTDLTAGQIILNEEPLLISPSDCENDSDPEYSCVGCYQILPTDYLTCSRCQFPICGPLCSQENFHSKLECKLFRDKGILPSTDAYRAFKFVRVFASMKKFPDRYQKFQRLAAGISPTLEKYSSVMNAECKSVWKFLTKKCQMPVTLSEVKRVWVAFEINSFVVQSDEEDGNQFNGNVVFEIASKFSHACFPNLEWFVVNEETDDGKRWKLQMLCIRDVKKGEILCISYKDTGLNYGTGLRRKIFENSLPFECLCSRCLDATEEGTFFSSFKCSTCKKGNLLPEDPLSSFTCSWKCSECSADMKGADIQKEIESIENYVNDFMDGNLTDFDLDVLDQFIDDFTGNPLHPNHYLIFNATYRWLYESDFEDELIPDTKESAKLFQKILTRFNNCIDLANKCLTTFDIAELEFSMVQAISAFAFKSVDMVTINAVNNPRHNFHYSRLLMKHLTHGHFWIQKQNEHTRRNSKMLFNELYTQWTSHCEAYRQELIIYEMEMEEKAFLQLRSIFE